MFEEELTPEQAKSKIRKLHIIFGLTSIVIGLALYGLLAAKGDAFHPLLNDKSILYPMLAIGLVIDVFVTAKLVPLLKTYGNP